MSDLIQVRKYLTITEEILHERGPIPDQARMRAAAIAVIKNPFAGRYEEDILPMMDALKPMGLEMSQRLIRALGGDPSTIDGYGKGAIVGEDGELEHGALWHVPGGYAMRELLGESKAIVPSSKKVGTLGSQIDVPLGHINAAYVRSHFDAMTVGVPDAPRRDEIVYVLAMTCGPRIHVRVGGLQADEVKGEDGLR